MRVQNFALRPFRARAAAARGARVRRHSRASGPVDRSRRHDHSSQFDFFFGESAQEWTLTKNWVSAHARPSTKSRLHSVSGLGSATLTRFVQLLPVSAAQHKSKSCESLVIELLRRTHVRCKPARTHTARTIASTHTHTHIHTLRSFSCAYPPTHLSTHLNALPPSHIPQCR